MLNLKQNIFRQVTIEDNAVAVALFGEAGENLKRLEKKLGVKLDTRGNVVSISGENEKVEHAEKLLN